MGLLGRPDGSATADPSNNTLALLLSCLIWPCSCCCHCRHVFVCVCVWGGGCIRLLQQVPTLCCLKAHLPAQLLQQTGQHQMHSDLRPLLLSPQHVLHPRYLPHMRSVQPWRWPSLLLAAACLAAGHRYLGRHLFLQQQGHAKCVCMSDQFAAALYCTVEMKRGAGDQPGAACDVYENRNTTTSVMKATVCLRCIVFAQRLQMARCYPDVMPALFSLTFALLGWFLSSSEAQCSPTVPDQP